MDYQVIQRWTQEMTRAWPTARGEDGDERVGWKVIQEVCVGTLLVRRGCLQKVEQRFCGIYVPGWMVEPLLDNEETENNQIRTFRNRLGIQLWTCVWCGEVQEAVGSAGMELGTAVCPGAKSWGVAFQAWQLPLRDTQKFPSGRGNERKRGQLTRIVGCINLQGSSQKEEPHWTCFQGSEWLEPQHRA